MLLGTVTCPLLVRLEAIKCYLADLGNTLARIEFSVTRGAANAASLGCRISAAEFNPPAYPAPMGDRASGMHSISIPKTRSRRCAQVIAACYYSAGIILALR